jgi:ELWxxDGT repeat protein
MKRILLFLSMCALGLPDVTGQSMLVKDINPGGSGSFPHRLTNFNQKLVFFADDGTNGYELWAVDSSGANLAYNINPGPSASGSFTSYINMAVAGNKVYFPADNGTQGRELYSWDGSGTPLLAADIHPGATSTILSEMVAMNGKIYFSADDPTTGAGIELYVFDPATNMVQRLSDINPGAGNSNPQNLVVYKGRLFFSAFSAANGFELYMYDPMTNSTSMVYDIETGVNSSTPQSMMVIGDKLYFSASTIAFGRELYSYDSLNVTRISDLNINSGNSIPGSTTGQNRIGSLNNILYYSADNGTSGVQLYKFNAATGSSSLVYKINPVGSSNPMSFVNYGYKLYFVANDGTHGNELWAYDGTTNTPVLMADIDSGANSSNPTNLTVYNNKLYFSASTTAYGTELYEYFDSAVTGVKNVRFDADVKIYPNPTASDLNIDMNLRNNETLEVRLADVTGKMVYHTGFIKYAAGNNRVNVPMAELTAGTYFYWIVNKEGRNCMSGKLVKQ